MKTLLKIFLSVLLFVAATGAFLTPGCAVPQHDPLVASAEKQLVASFKANDAFLRWEEGTRVPGSPASVAADRVRDSHPKLYSEATRVIRRYKLTRESGDRADLSSMLIRLRSSYAEALKYLPPDISGQLEPP